MSDNTNVNRFKLIVAALDKFYSQSKDKQNDGLVSRVEVNEFKDEYQRSPENVLNKLSSFTSSADEVSSYYETYSKAQIDIARQVSSTPSPTRIERKDLDNFVQLMTGNNYENWQKFDWDGKADSDFNVDRPFWYVFVDRPDDLDISQVDKQADFINNSSASASSLISTSSLQMSNQVLDIPTLSEAQDPRFAAWKDQLVEILQKAGVNQETLDKLFKKLEEEGYFEDHTRLSGILSKGLFVQENGDIVITLDENQSLFINKVASPPPPPDIARPREFASMKEEDIRNELKNNNTQTERRQLLVQELFNRYYETNKNIPNEQRRPLDLAGLNLSGIANLQKFNSAGAFRIDGVKINFSNSNLSGANLENANLTGANLTGTNLSQAKLNGAKLIKAQMAGINLQKSSFINADLTEADFSLQSNESEETLVADIREADFTGAKLDKARLAPIKDTSGSSDTHFFRAEGAVFANASMNATYLSGNFKKVNFVSARMNNAFLGGEFIESSFVNANMSHAVFAGLLWDSDLRGADLIGANMTNYTSGLKSNTRKSFLDGAKYNINTKFDQVKISYSEGGISQSTSFDPKRMGMQVRNN